MNVINVEKYYTVKPHLKFMQISTIQKLIRNKLTHLYNSRLGQQCLICLGHVPSYAYLNFPAFHDWSSGWQQHCYCSSPSRRTHLESRLGHYYQQYCSLLGARNIRNAYNSLVDEVVEAAMETGGILQIGVNLTIKESQINESDAPSFVYVYCLHTY